MPILNIQIILQLKESKLLSKRLIAGAIAGDPEAAFTYAALKKMPFPEGEAMIARSAYYSFMYASIVLDGRFEAGEKAIANSMYGSEYASRILEGKYGMTPEESRKWMIGLRP